VAAGPDERGAHPRGGAASLRQLGLHRATDMDGGFRQWRARGHRVVPGVTPTPATITQPSSNDDQQDLPDHGGLDRRMAGPAGPPLRVDEERWSVHVHGRPVPLTRQEMVLLVRLRRADGRVLSRRALLDTIDGLPRVAYRTVDVHIHRLRRKLGPDVGACLVTVRGVGYAFDPDRWVADTGRAGTAARAG
jgi:DNA-binding winged helix-turn-helix (wHTH) protein